VWSKLSSLKGSDRRAKVRAVAAFIGILLKQLNLWQIWSVFILDVCLICFTYNHIKMVQILTFLRPFQVTEFLYTHRHYFLGWAQMPFDYITKHRTSSSWFGFIGVIKNICHVIYRYKRLLLILSSLWTNWGHNDTNKLLNYALNNDLYRLCISSTF